MARTKLAVQSDALTTLDSLTYTDLIDDPERPGYLLNPLTGERWQKLSPQQDQLAHYIVHGMNRRDAVRAAGFKLGPAGASSYVYNMISTHAPFVNRLLELASEHRHDGEVSYTSHIKRLAELSRQAEKDGRHSAAIAAEVHRGRVAGLYAKENPSQGGDKPNETLDSIEHRIQELLSKVDEKEVGQKRIVATQDKDSGDDDEGTD